MLSLSVSLRVRSDRLDEFLSAISDSQSHSLQDEAACLRFDVARDLEDPCLFHLYEVYESKAAVEAHRTSSHFLRWSSVAVRVLEENGRVSRLGEILPVPAARERASR